MDRRYKEIIKQHTISFGLGPPLYHCQQDSVELPCNYYCSLVVCGTTFSTSVAYQSKQQAEIRAAKLACTELKLIPFNQNETREMHFIDDETYDEHYSIQPAHKQPFKRQLQKQSNFPLNSKKAKMFRDTRSSTEIAQYLQVLPTDLVVQDNSNPIPVSSMKDVWRYMHGDVLASSFKGLLNLFCQMEQCDFPKYKKIVLESTAPIRHCTTVTYKGETFESIGPMLTRKQAELSAAEVCLRSMGYLPTVTSLEEYTIQPYKGGKGINWLQKQFSSENYLLKYILYANRLPSPVTQVKEIKGNDGMVSHIGYVCVDDKMFESPTPSDRPFSARLKANILALQYFNVELNEKTLWVRFSTIHHDNREILLKFNGHLSPFANCPSENLGWIHDSFKETPPLINGVQLTEAELKAKMTVSVVPGDKVTQEEEENPYKTYLTQEPTFQCTLLKNLKDLMVCKVDASNPNVVVVGDKNFSINMFCNEQKLFSSNRGCLVKLLPGHNISGIECNYIFTPSNDIYLQARSCYDLYFPNRPKPIVRSCCVVLIMHDQEAGDYPYVIFTRPLSQDGFPAVSSHLSEYLNSLITGDASKTLDTTRLVSNIQTWKEQEVNLISQMTMDSMYELYSEFTKYDSRWNEVFMNPLTKDLIELKEICNKELDQRRNSNPVIEKEELNWMLQRFDFKPRLLPTGPYIEDSVMCAIRGFRNLTGIRLKLGDFDEIPYVDVPITEPGHRGAVDRYFIWARTVTDENRANYYTKAIMHKFNGNVGLYGLKTPSKTDELTEGVENKDNIHEEEEPEGEQKTPTPSNTPCIKVECKWFCVTEAPNINASFKQLIESPTFTNAMTEMKKSKPLLASDVTSNFIGSS